MERQLTVRRSLLRVQAHYESPAFDLFKDLPALIQSCYVALSGTGIRLSNISYETPGPSLADINLHLTWPQLASVRIFLDRIDIRVEYLPFLEDSGGKWLFDLLEAVAMAAHLKYRAFQVGQELDGHLEIPRKDFLAQFSASGPASLGEPLGSRTVFYYGPSDSRLLGSLHLDLSSLVENGLYLWLDLMLDASKVDSAGIILVFREQLEIALHELGLTLKVA